METLIRSDFSLSHHRVMQQTSYAYNDARFNSNPDRSSAKGQSLDQQSLPGTRWQPQSGPLLVVGPHPRDEIVGAGGLIHTWISWGHEVTVLSVTDGEADKVDAEHLDLMRRDELRAALRKLCATHVSVVRMGLPDGHVREAQNRLRHAIEALLEPNMTLVAPCEQGGHPDHEAVGKVCREAALANQVPMVQYVMPCSQPHVAIGEAAKWGCFPLDVEARRAKAYALQCFNSQRLGIGKPDPLLSSFEAFLL
jgi:LmbE family N-acetylglucosaminyl deacetylase